MHTFCFFNVNLWGCLSSSENETSVKETGFFGGNKGLLKFNQLNFLIITFVITGHYRRNQI